MFTAADRDAFFRTLWDDFVVIAPQAASLHAAFERLGETVVNDHVAIRTFDRASLSLDQLEPIILRLGYQALDDYRFPEKHLRARAYVCDEAPRIFLSELVVDELGAESRAIVESCVEQVELSTPMTRAVFRAGRLWEPLRFADYERLADESEYAAWLCAHGMHANHFTVSVNALRRLTSVAAVLDFVEKQGFAINAAGGRVKGSAELHLEQGSTVADRVSVPFADGPRIVPSCYYEFAHRYSLPDGTLYQGFVTQSADKIFESTDRAPLSR
jgi:hypothetical protein